MEGDHIRPGEEIVQFHIFRSFTALVVLPGVIGDDLHPQGGADGRRVPPDVPQADKAQGLALQLDEGIVPVAPVLAVFPFALIDGFAVMADVVAHLQQQGDGELADGGGAVGGHVGDGDALRPGVDIVHHVVAGGQYGDVFDAGTGVQHLPGDGGLVGQHYLRVPNAVDCLLPVREAGAIVDRQFPQGPEGLPAEIAGVFRVAVQYHNFHNAAS